ncbi:MAG: ribonuclease [Clostridia bacterium]|nr:ribonuclease [Clostridia bacterium]
MKRILAVLSVLILSLLLVAGCSGGANSNQPSGNNAGTESSYTVGRNDISKEALTKAESEVTKDGVYVTPAHVAAYLHKFNKLPSNFITKKEAQKLGWKNGKQTVSDAAPGKSIGGDYYGNYEQKLPEGRYHECDINYEGGKRGSERIVYDEDGDIYYSADHYNTFTQLYGEDDTK